MSDIYQRSVLHLDIEGYSKTADDLAAEEELCSGCKPFGFCTLVAEGQTVEGLGPAVGTEHAACLTNSGGYKHCPRRAAMTINFYNHISLEHEG